MLAILCVGVFAHGDGQNAPPTKEAQNTLVANTLLSLSQTVDPSHSMPLLERVAKAEAELAQRMSTSQDNSEKMTYGLTLSLLAGIKLTQTHACRLIVDAPPGQTLPKTLKPVPFTTDQIIASDGACFEEDEKGEFALVATYSQAPQATRLCLTFADFKDPSRADVTMEGVTIRGIEPVAGNQSNKGVQFLGQSFFSEEAKAVSTSAFGAKNSYAVRCDRP